MSTAEKFRAVVFALGTCNAKSLRKLLTGKQVAVLQLGVALFFAAAILLVTFLLRHTEHSSTAMFALIAIWSMPFSVLSAVSARSGESRCGSRPKPLS